MNWILPIAVETWIIHPRSPKHESFSDFRINQDHTIKCAVFLLYMFFQWFAFLAYPLGFACFSSFSTVSLDSAVTDSRLSKSSVACWWAGFPSFARLNQDSLQVWNRRGWSVPLLLTFPFFSFYLGLFPQPNPLLLCPQFRILPFLHLFCQEHNCFIALPICFLAVFTDFTLCSF